MSAKDMYATEPNFILIIYNNFSLESNITSDLLN